MDYKNTLNLPETAFPMKANLPIKELEILKFWEDKDIYNKILESRKNSNMFVLHDGPPYANGHIHMGTALNKILKDMVIKSKTMMGYSSPYVPGWDCHGLPIEHNVEKEYGVMDKAKTRKACRDYATKFIDIQKQEFKRLGVLGQWDKPYLTMSYDYEATIYKEFLEFLNNGYVYESKKPVHWCMSCKTSLALAEIEYEEDKSISIYVKFDFISDLGSEDKKFLGKAVSAVIWTTTPWTLPANLAVAVGPDIDYVFVQVKEREVLLVAKELCDKLMEKFEIKDAQIIKETKGKDLEGYELAHPFYDRISKMILSEYVNLEMGTGLVHTAPGHGEEDYEVGLKYNLSIYSPVDEDGRFTQDVQYFAGEHVFKANEKIIELLKKNGMLLKEEEIVHSYPHCWRCKKPVIFKATKQWFISLEKNDLRSKALEEIKKVQWIPKSGQNRIYAMVENRPDWCISRQRAWGVPIALFRCKKCGRIVKDKEILDFTAKSIEQFGADVWFEKDNVYFLPKDYKCECGSQDFEKVEDILDVWFDSGVSHKAVLYNKIKWPADMYLEGSDQHRGWFHSSLLESVGTLGKAPYKSVLTHGFVVDAKGRKMSKSLGNVIAPQSIIEKYGADILRLWACATDYREDIKLSNEIMTRLIEGYRKIRNTIRFLLGNLSDFYKERSLKYEDLEEIDKWILAELENLKEKLFKAYENYEFHLIYQNVTNFCINTLSSFYLDILKDTLYCDSLNSKKRLSAQTAMKEVLDVLIKFLAPILSFTAEEAYQLNKPEKESVHMEYFVPTIDKYKNEPLREKWSLISKIRLSVLKALELAREQKYIGNSLEADVYLNSNNSLVNSILFDERINLADIFIVSHVFCKSIDNALVDYTDETLGLIVKVTKAIGEKCDRCWKFDESVSKNENHLCKRCQEVINEQRLKF
ncbi:MAG: isoleucine--tRNA ligase [Desulfurella sp.]|uniref:isoleucine--tRNA ligase n=1 Tax=Desulfurella sp. TaxID=1962857 RepID=UPI000CCB45BF|nr:isoleucine--tRNA ligase [Desulfurella sp.]PMP87439.1 MAG: isoleucine--tRNA ligase [Desulfurella sp.]HEX13594.1 isoleucine--tRNA ligase [Desulfurella acetivorans]